MCERMRRAWTSCLRIYFVRAAIEAHADTLILASRDTDLLPAVEMAVDFGKVQVETVRGKNALRLGGGRSLWCTYLSGSDYRLRMILAAGRLTHPNLR
jgi:hypothetical protein